MINKIDLPSAEPERVAQELVDTLGLRRGRDHVRFREGGHRHARAAAGHRRPHPAAAGHQRPAAPGADLRQQVRRLQGRHRLRARRRRCRQQPPQAAPDVDEPGRRSDRGRHLPPGARTGGRARPGRGRLRRDGAQEREGVPRRRHVHGRRQARGRSAGGLSPRQTDGLRRPLPLIRKRVHAAARRARQAAAQRRVAGVRAGVERGAGVRLPLRFPGPAAHGDRAGAPGARVRPQPARDRAERRVPGDEDQRPGDRHRQPRRAAAAAGDRPDPRAVDGHLRRYAGPLHRPGDGAGHEQPRRVQADGVPATQHRRRTTGRRRARGAASTTASRCPRSSSTSTTS